MSSDLDFAYSLRRYARTHCSRKQEIKTLLTEAADIIERQHAKLNPDSTLSQLWGYFDQAVEQGDQGATRQALLKITEVQL